MRNFQKKISLDSKKEEFIQGKRCWISTCLFYSLKLKTKKQQCWLTVRTELWREQEVDQNEKSDWIHATSPLVYIGFCPDKDDYWEEESLKLDVWGSPIVYEDNEGKIVEPTDKNPWLWEWQLECNKDEKEWSERDWFYAVPLFDINSTNDIQKQILDPLKSLLVNNKSPEEAFKDKKAIK